IFRGSITRPLDSLSTLRAGLSTDYARLGSGNWLGFTGQDWVPEGFLQKVSKNIIVNPPFMGLTWRNNPNYSRNQYEVIHIIL
ncbi:MAG TPA: hypothetical protein VKA34_13475, partial [Balneolales bacterium]|nr:hypothetical protein [Balneolales bacterium]